MNLITSKMDVICARETECWNGLSYACHKVGVERGFTVVCLSFHVRDWILSQDSDCYKRAWCATYSRAGLIREQALASWLEERTRRRERGFPVMFILDLIDYDVEGVSSVSHSVALFWSGGKLLLVNPHGHEAKNNFEYECAWTRTRTKRVRLRNALDLVIIAPLAAYIHSKEPALWEPTPEHNYWGKCLQEDDEVGICYAFPILLANIWDPVSQTTPDSIVEAMQRRYPDEPCQSAVLALEGDMPTIQKTMRSAIHF